jgi:hypothetical protein
VSRVDPAVVDARTLAASETRPRTTAGVVTFVAVVILLVLVATRAVPHPVGPARTFSKYEGKAVTTAEGALSEVRTVALGARAFHDGHAFRPYTATLVSGSEDGVSKLQGTFDSIQPPDARADHLQRELDALLSDSLDHVRDVRVAVRRGARPGLPALIAPLDADGRKLEAFVSRHQ